MEHLLTTLCLLSFFSGYSQYCTTVGPSNTGDSNTENVVLNGVSGGINYTGCTGTGGVGVVGLEDLTATQSVTLNSGDSYTAFVKFGTCTSNYPGFGEAWIDFNGNEVFDSSESIGNWSGTPPLATPLSFSFTVPAFSIVGPTRMRVTQQELVPGLPLDPCASFTWGSTVDFTVILQGGIPCTGNNTLDPYTIPFYPYTDTGTTIGCYSNASTVYISPDVFYLAVLDPLKDSLRVSLCGSSFDTHLSIHKTNGDVIYYNDDFAGCGAQSEILFPTAGLDSIYIVVEGWGTFAGNYILNVDNDYNTIVGMHHIAQKDYAIRIYPNPTRDRINISGILPEQIVVYSMDGRRMPTTATNTSSIDISILPTGIYIIELLYEGHLHRDKIIKQ